ALTNRTRREAAQIALRPPSVGFDHEARPLDEALGVAVRVAAAGDPDPEPLEPVLEPGLPRPGRAHVLEHTKPAVRAEDAPDLREPASRVRDAAEDQAAHHRVERAVVERQRLGAAADETRARRAPSRAPERGPRGIETDDADAVPVEGEVPAGPTPHVERQPARAVDEPSPPASEANPLAGRADRIVEPGDLLEAAHGSGLREHDQGARVGAGPYRAPSRQMKMLFCGPGASTTSTDLKPTSSSMRRAVSTPQAVPSPAPPSASDTVMQCRTLTPYMYGVNGLPILSSRL